MAAAMRYASSTRSVLPGGTVVVRRRHVQRQGQAARSGNACDNELARWRAELWHPGGLQVVGERVYIADTNHNTVVTARLGTDRVEEVEIRGGELSPAIQR